MSHQTEGCRQLSSPVPLKEGEQHCPFCAGFGAHPINKRDTTRSQFNPDKCHRCNGTGKRS